MRRYPAGRHVRGGLYLNPLTGQVAVVPPQGGALRGTEGFYVRLPVPPALGILLAPLAGAIFVILLPLIGLGLMVWLVCRKVWVATGMGEALSALFARAHGRPGWAFLLGGRRDGAARAPGGRAAGGGATAGRHDKAKETK
jgi:hypothetical protein